MAGNMSWCIDNVKATVTKVIDRRRKAGQRLPLVVCLPYCSNVFGMPPYRRKFIGSIKREFILVENIGGVKRAGSIFQDMQSPGANEELRRGEIGRRAYMVPTSRRSISSADHEEHANITY